MDPHVVLEYHAEKKGVFVEQHAFFAFLLKVEFLI